jgi:hypothetical protein
MGVFAEVKYFSGACADNLDFKATPSIEGLIMLRVVSDVFPK